MDDLAGNQSSSSCTTSVGVDSTLLLSNLGTARPPRRRSSVSRPQKVMFINCTQTPLHLYWLDRVTTSAAPNGVHDGGVPRLVTVCEAGMKVSVDTFATHQWRIRPSSVSTDSDWFTTYTVKRKKGMQVCVFRDSAGGMSSSTEDVINTPPPKGGDAMPYEEAGPCCAETKNDGEGAGAPPSPPSSVPVELHQIASSSTEGRGPRNLHDNTAHTTRINVDASGQDVVDETIYLHRRQERSRSSGCNFLEKPKVQKRATGREESAARSNRNNGAEVDVCNQKMELPCSYPSLSSSSNSDCSRSRSLHRASVSLLQCQLSSEKMTGTSKVAAVLPDRDRARGNMTNTADDALLCREHLDGRKKLLGTNVDADKNIDFDPNSCFQCGRKLGLRFLPYTCRCSRSFCKKHKDAEEHGCRFDWQREGQSDLAAQQPRVVAERMPHRFE
ncbi:unnamed protein product [Amoebophrya sp. A120]|nr:unnamed protein product [Amoebophrya sp. A120]|eukprot:GSA120T00003782001.1